MALTQQQTQTGAFSVDLATLRRPLRVSARAWPHLAGQLDLGRKTGSQPQFPPLSSGAGVQDKQLCVSSGLSCQYQSHCQHLC